MGVSDCRPTVAEIDLGACVANYRQVAKYVAPTDVWAVVKADAYGHGAAQVARALQMCGKSRPSGFCVATASEGAELRASGIDAPVLVMTTLANGGERDPYRLVVEHRLIAAVSDAAAAGRLRSAVRKGGNARVVDVQIKVDTGMRRLGVGPDIEPVVALASDLMSSPEIRLGGLFSNLATAGALAGSAEHDFVAEQAASFRRILLGLGEAGLSLPWAHLANSAGVAHHPVTWRDSGPEGFTGVRPGLALYGATLACEPSPLRLRRVMSLRTRVAALRWAEAGTAVGYGMSFRSERRTRLGVLPLGYHDGLPRALSHPSPHGRHSRPAEVLLRGCRVPIVGRISMDATIVDVTDVPDATVGDTVWLFGGPQAEGLAEPSFAVEEIAHRADSIPHEVLSRLGGRVPRVFLNAPRALPDGAPSSATALAPDIALAEGSL